MRIRLSFCAAMIAAMLCTSLPVLSQTPFGINWMNLDTTLHSHTWVHFNDDTIGYNTYHAQGSLSGLQSWSSKSTSKIIARYLGSALDEFSKAELMKYNAYPKDNSNDTLTNFYFMHTHQGYAYDAANPATPYSPPFDHWEIPASPDSTNMLAIDSSEYFWLGGGGGWTWRDTAHTPFYLVVKMQVDSVDTSSTKNALEIRVKQIRSVWNYPTETQYIDTFYVPWKWFTKKDTDFVFRSSSTFTFPNNMLASASSDSGYVTNASIEIWSTDTVEARVAWVTLEDIYADSLLAGLPEPQGLDPNNPAWVTNAQTAQREYIAAADSLKTKLGTSLEKIYLFDEPGTSEFASQGRMEFILADSGYTGETERTVWLDSRYAAMVTPPSLRCGSWGTSPGGQGAVDYLDNGPGFGKVVCYDSSGAYSYDTLYKYKMDQYGYFPFKNGNYVPDSVYAFDTTHFIIRNDSACPNKTDYSFDFYDFARESSHPEQAYPGIPGNNMYSTAMYLDSIVYLNPVSGAIKEWWANNFMHGQTPADSVYNSLGAYVPNPNGSGYYTWTAAATPEELSMTSNFALSMGARGLLYWWASTGNTGVIETGFTDRLGRDSSDYDVISGNSIPAMYKRDCQWAQQYAAFLKGAGDSLFKAKWLGASIRTMQNSANWIGVGGDTLKPFTQTVMRSGYTMLVDTAGDASKRWLLDSVKFKHSVASFPTTFRKILPGDTLIKQVSLPQNLCWVTYGYFQDTVQKNPAEQTFYITAVNNMLDSRDLLCHWQSNWGIISDSGGLCRGSREIYTKLNMDSLISKYWKVKSLDNTVDTLVPFAGTIHAIYPPGGMEIFKITPSYDAFVAKGDIEFNNGRRAEYDSIDGFYHTTYFRNDSVFYRRSTGAATLEWGPEICVDAPGGIYTSADHPSLRLVKQPSGTPPVIAITYSKTDSANYHVFVSANADTGNVAGWLTPIQVASFSKMGTTFLPTPVLAPYYINSSTYGVIAAWSRGKGSEQDIGVCAVDLNAFTTGTPVYFDADSNFNQFPVLDTVAGFPTIAEGPNPETFGLAFQEQPSGSEAQIFFSVLTFNYSTMGITYSLPKWVSTQSGPGACDNEHPCIDGAFEYSQSAEEIMMAPGVFIPTVFAYIPNHPFQYMPGPGSNHPDWVWSIAYDQPYNPEVPYSSSPVTVHGWGVIWTASLDTLNKWQYTLFSPTFFTSTIGVTLPQFYYPSLRTYTGWDTSDNLPAQLAFYTNQDSIFLARTTNLIPLAHDSAWTVFPYREVSSTILAYPNPNSAKTPNLEKNGASEQWYQDQHLMYLSTATSDVRITTDSIAGYNSSYDPISKIVHISASDSLLNYDFCPQICGDIAPVRSTTELRTLVDLPKSPWVVVRAYNPITQAAQGLGLLAITDTLRVTSVQDTFQFIGSAGPADSANAAAWLSDTGSITFITEAASATTGATLQTIDSMEFKEGILSQQSTSFYANLSDIMDSLIFFRLRVEKGRVKATAQAADEITFFDTLDTGGGMEKEGMRYVGRAGVVPVGSNPINMSCAPNPFMNNAQISYTVPDADGNQPVQVFVFDMLARTVATLVNNPSQPAGQYTISLDGSHLPAGSYIAAVHTQSNQQSKLLILTK